MEVIGSYNPREVYSLAIQIEEEGKSFYERAAADTDREDVRALFLFLAEEENHHIIRFRDLLASTPEGETGLTEYDRYLRNLVPAAIFPDAALELDELEALQIAMEAERKSILLYSEAAALASTPESEDAFRKVAAIERGHLRELLAVKNRIFPETAGDSS